MATTPFSTLPAGAGSSRFELPGAANAAGELAQAGMSFGKLVEFTGKAVAETQLKLSQTGTAMASTLATTQVDVIAVQENIYDDEGRLDDAVTHTRKLPLINFIDPVFYKWSAVRLQGFFFARELVASTEQTTTQDASSSRLLGSGLSFVLGPGAMSFSNSSSTTTSNVDVSQDLSFGNIRASALLEPERDIGVPRPRQVVRGPSLGVVSGDIQDVLNGTAVTARTMSVLLQLRRTDGTPIAGKPISIDSDGAPWTFTNPAQTVTNATGDLAITLRREFVGETPDLSPKPVVLTARLGLVSNSETLTF
jgi:hypothetical protein